MFSLTIECVLSDYSTEKEKRPAAGIYDTDAGAAALVSPTLLAWSGTH